MLTHGLEIRSFSNEPGADWQKVREFVQFHRDHYAAEPRYIPLLDYEYLGSKLLGMVGFLEPRNSFFKTGRIRFFMAYRDGKPVGRVNAYLNDRHNQIWKDQVGFFGNFECIDDSQVASALLESCESWLKAQGMNAMRGPLNFPMNEATPGVLVEGFDSRPVVYYHFNYEYYARLLRDTGLAPIKNYFSWDISVNKNPIEEDLGPLSRKIMARYQVTLEPWSMRKLDERKKEMFDIYNDAWSDNFGFVPFLREEFYRIIDDMQLVMNPKMFLFAYVKGEPAAFFGAVPNIFEILSPKAPLGGIEILRAAKLLAFKSKIRGFRLGYLGVKKSFRKLGLDGLLFWRQNQVSREEGYEYCDIGWVLEDNPLTIRLVERTGAVLSKKYTLFEKEIVTR